jgi:DinB family protein
VGRLARHRLAARLREAADRLLAVIEPIDAGQWRLVPNEGESISKVAEHAAAAAHFHLWIVRLTIGEKVSSRRPTLERKQMTSDLSPSEAAELIRQRVEEGTRLILGLTDEQLDLPTKPPRAKAPALAQTIESALIGHLDTHRTSIETKLRAIDDRRDGEMARLTETAGRPELETRR